MSITYALGNFQHAWLWIISGGLIVLLRVFWEPLMAVLKSLAETLEAWRRANHAKIDLQIAESKLKQQTRSEYLENLDRRMHVEEEKVKKEKRVWNLVFEEEFYISRLSDDAESIREVLYRRANKSTSSSVFRFGSRW